MVILVKYNKTPIISKNTRIYQGENLIDILDIYVQENFGSYVISDFSVSLIYVDPGNIMHTELLEAVDDTEQDKTGYIKYRLPLTTELTKLAGNIRMYFSMVSVDDETTEQIVLHTDEVKLKIETFGEHYVFVPDSGMNAIDQKILEVHNEINKTKAMQEQFNKEVPNDLALDVNDRIHLMRDKKVIGNGVEVVVPMRIDHVYDETNDGVINVDHVSEEADPVTDEAYDFVDFDKVEDYDSESDPQNRGYQFLEL